MKILIVDDIEENLYLLEVLLKGSGYEVVTAEDGIEALRKIKKETIDLIISDILMPRMDGFQLCKECKKDDNIKRIPFIFYTGTYIDTKDEEFALSLGAAKFILKPQEPETFLKILKKVIKEHKKEVLIAPKELMKEDEGIYFEKYNKRLIQKLEKKMLDLEKANKILQEKEEIIYHLNQFQGNIIHNANVWINALDEKGSVTLWNEAAEKISGYSAAEVIGHDKIWQWLYPDEKYRKEIFAKINAMIEKGEVFQDYETRISCKDGKVKNISWHVRNLTNLQGKIIGSVAISRDITAEKEIDRMKTEFISTVSHELRTPLSITREGINLVLDKIPGKINKKQGKILSIAKNNIDRLARIINSLLDISKIESGEVELKRESVNIKSLIEQVASSFESKIKEKGLEIKVNLPKERLEVLAEGDKIIEVLTNLLGNSLKFTEKGYIEVSAKELEDEIECTVKDTGMGIPTDDLPKIFGKFQQFSRVDGEGEKGTGLGLSISKGIVEAHHGKIRVESTLGEGSNFIFTLPQIAIQELFLEYINNGISEAIKKNSKMSILLVSIFELDKLKQKLSRQILDSTLKDVEVMLRKNHVRAGDVMISENNQYMVMVNNCDQESILKVENRIEKMLNNYLENRNLAKDIKFVLGSATYPDDALYADKLLKQARTWFIYQNIIKSNQKSVN